MRRFLFLRRVFQERAGALKHRGHLGLEPRAGDTRAALLSLVQPGRLPVDALRFVQSGVPVHNAFPNRTN